jgi:hypothetical protein
MTASPQAISRPRSLAVIVGCSIASVALTGLGVAALFVAPTIRSESPVENMPAGMLAAFGVMLILGGIVGGAVCLGCASLVPRVRGARGIAFLAGSMALAVPILVLIGWIVLPRIA